MNNGELNLVTLSQPTRIPVGALYLGNISNACTTVITGTLRINGDTSDTALLPPAAIGPASFSIVGYSAITGTGQYTCSIPFGATPGAWQASIAVQKGSVSVGKIVVSLVVLDLTTPDTDDMSPPATLGGLQQLLQVSQEDYEII